jgi:hypothetical protein
MLDEFRFESDDWVWHAHGRQGNGPYEAQRPNCIGVRVALGTGYTRERGVGQASRTGRVSCSPTGIPIRAIRASNKSLFHMRARTHVAHPCACSRRRSTAM